MERPLFTILISIIAGLFSAHLTNLHIPPTIIYSLVLATLLSLFCKERYLFTAVASLLLFFSANNSLQTIIFPEYDVFSVANNCSSSPVTVEGVVTERPELKGKGGRVQVESEWLIQGNVIKRVNGLLLLNVREGKIDLVSGDRIRFTSRLKRPRNFGVPGEFDRVRHFLYKKIQSLAVVARCNDIIFMGNSGLYPIKRSIDQIAGHVGSFIANNSPEAEGSVLNALLLGEKGGVPEVLRDSYTKAGVNHILSISGFHVGIIALFLFQLFVLSAKCSEYVMLRVNIRRMALAVALPFLLFYLVLSGSSPSTLRAVIMIVVFIAAMALSRQVDPLDTLMLAAVLMLAISPTDLFEISFQLSFTAIWGILVLAPKIYSFLDLKLKKRHGKLLLFFSASLAATISSIIPVVFYFHRATVAGLISNFLIVPLLGYGAIVIGISALPFIFLAPPVAAKLISFSSFFVSISNSLILALSQIPMLPLLHISKLQLGIAYLMFTIITFMKYGRVMKIVSLNLLVIFFAAGATLGHDERGKLTLTFFSVGQGESSMVRFPNGKVMIIDGGGGLEGNEWDPGENLVAPALWESGIDSIDYLVLSHPHPDHIRGLIFIANNFSIGEFWQGGYYPQNKEYLELMEILRQKGVPIRNTSTGKDKVNIGKASVEFLAPIRGGYLHKKKSVDDLNNQSVVLRMQINDFSALFTGDIGMDVETQLVAAQHIQSTLLKLPHHGSRFASSPDFLRAVSPKIAVVSAGYENNFHLPSNDTVARLKKLGIPLYRTDLDGTIRIVFDPEAHGDSRVVISGHFH